MSAKYPRLKPVRFLPIFNLMVFLAFGSAGYLSAKPDTITPIKVLPVRTPGPGDRIPPFFVMHRQYMAVGHSQGVPMRVDGTGKLNPAPTGECPASPPTPGPVTGKDWVYPAPGWKVQIQGWSADPSDNGGDALRLIYRLTPQDPPKTFLIPEWKNDIVYCACPFYYDDTAGRFYFTTVIGPTGYRRGLLLRFTLATEKLEEIGETWEGARLSPDRQWILWFPGDYVEIGGKHVYPVRMSLFSVRDNASLILTQGVVADQFRGWDMK